MIGDRFDQVVWDIDGCLYDFVGHWGAWVGVGSAVRADRWEFYKDHGYTTSEFRGQLERMGPAMWDYSPYWGYQDGAIEVLATAPRGDVEDWIVTARVEPEGAAAKRYRRRARWLLRSTAKFHFTGGETSKAAWCVDAGFDPDRTLVVEDSPAEIDAYLRAGFLNVYVPDHNYCRGLGTLTADTVEWLATGTASDIEVEGWSTPEPVPVVAARANSGKPSMHYPLTFRKALEALSRVFEQGAVKYEPYNYLKGGKPDQEYLDSALRHLAALVDGEAYDAETGCRHEAHAVWNLMAYTHLNHGDEPASDPLFDQDAFLAEWGK